MADDAMGPLDLMLHDITAKYNARGASNALLRLYEDREFGVMFAFLHEQFNNHFGAINGRAQAKRHYWAEGSRKLIALIDELKEDFKLLKLAGIEVSIDPDTKRR